MPVTAKLSRAFYERLGDTIANELVDLLNLMDSTYVTELRQQNEVNFARFDAKLDQRFAEQDAKWERRLSSLEARIAVLEGRFTALDSSLDARIDAKVAPAIAASQQAMIRWMVGLWLTALIAGAAGFAQLLSQR